MSAFGDHFRRQRNIGRDHQIAGRNPSDDFIVRHIEAFRHL